jgi:hypothetical protein
MCLARAWMLLVLWRPGAVEAEVRAAERGYCRGRWPTDRVRSSRAPWRPSRTKPGPRSAAKASMTLKFPLLGAFALAGTGALDAFFYPVTTGAVSLLMAYALASVSVLRLYVLFCHLTPGPAPPHGLFTYLVGGLAGARAHGRGRTPASQRRPRA